MCVCVEHAPPPPHPQAVLNPDLPDPEEAQAQEQEQIDSAEPLTEEEGKEKEDLLQQVGQHLSPSLWGSSPPEGVGEEE